METVGNSLGRAPLRRSDAEATTRWTERKPREIAWGEPFCGKERGGSDDRVDGRETVGNIAWEKLRWAEGIF